MASAKSEKPAEKDVGNKKEEEELDDDERDLDCIGYKTSTFATVLYYIGCVLSVGGLWLVCHWKPAWRVVLTASKCRIQQADCVVFKDNHGSWTTEDIFEELLTGDGWGKSTSHEMCDATSSREDATLLVNEERCPTNVEEGDAVTKTRFFIYHKLRFIFDDQAGKFILLRALDCGVSCAAIRHRRAGLTMLEYCKQKVLYGMNSMDVEVKPYWKLIIDEALDPFYIFQLFSLVVWILEVYYIYAGCILFISLISILTDVVEVRRQMKTLRDMVAKPSTVTVRRNDENVNDVSSLELVPGDIIVISSKGLEMPCDAALLSGTCVVNESMLTGESVPVTKTPLPDVPSPHDPPDHPANLYSPARHKRHTLFCGTKVIQTRTFDRDFALAIVVRTGFTTAKGSLVRSILFPKPVGFQFFRDALRFVGFLAILAMLGLIYSLVILHIHGVGVYESILEALDVVTIAVPPALPAAMTIGIVYAQRRLRRQQIFCISPPRINISGKLKLFCFDKTGTLTNDGMDLTAIYPTTRGSFSEPVEKCSDLPRDDLLFCMATCHSLNVIDGELVGDPLDLKMFEATNWVFEERSSETRWDPSVMSVVHPADVDPLNFDMDQLGPPGLQLGIMHQYTFSSELQRMSVLVQRLGAGRETHVFCKGAPETVERLCDPSTVPENFGRVLVQLTQQGYRVLACASRKLSMPWHTYKNMARIDAEKDLQFTGLLVLCNTLKPETAPIIQELHNADIRTVMVTGDNIQTAVSVARECGMIHTQQKVIMVSAHLPPDMDVATEGDSGCEIPVNPSVQFSSIGEPLETLTASLNVSVRVDENSYQNGHGPGYSGDGVRLAISGKSFAVVRQHCPELLKRLLLRGTVFARMAPQQKTQLVQELQSLGYSVGMCGDGANDCGALKAAHAGISLSEAEASIASPFTSKVPNISCVPILIREGRAALVTSFSVFKFMALYSIIQFVSVLILYTFKSNLGDTQYLYVDLILILTFAFVMGRTHAYPKLVRRRPPGSLSGVQTLASLITQIIIQASFQAGALEYLRAQPWLPMLRKTDKPVHGNDDKIVLPENYVVFIISSFQYIWVAAAFSAGRPYRRPAYTNYLFSLAIVVLTLLTAWFLFYFPRPLATFLQLDQRMYHDTLFRVALLEMAMLNCALSVIVEFFVLPSQPVMALLRKLRNKRQPKNRYKLVEREIRNDPNWPPLVSPEDCHVQDDRVKDVKARSSSARTDNSVV